MTQKIWAIQLAGWLAILTLLVVTLPRYTQILPMYIVSGAQQHLNKEGMQWATVQSKQPNSRAVVVNGHAANAEQQQTAINTVQSLWYVQHVDDAIETQIIEPYRLNIQWDGRKLILDGYVSSHKDQAELTEKITAFFGNNNDLSRLQTGMGAPKNWQQLIEHLLFKVIKPLELASVRIVGQTISFAGKAATSKEVEALKTLLGPFKAQGYHIAVNMAAQDNAAVVCQREFNRLLSQEKINFQSGGSTIDSKSNVLLQQLADTAIFCGNATIRIIGHTDDVGSEENNLRLSEQRAKAIKGWLFNQGGVPLERLRIEGKGTSQPLANNDTETNRAKNRRIEFIVEGI